MAGRPLGSKNKQGHNAGGDHRSEQFKTSRRRSRSLSALDRASKPSNASKRAATTVPAVMLSAAERKKKYEEGLEQTQTDIRRTFNHPSNRYGVVGLLSSRDQESLWLEDDGEEPLIEQLTNDGTFEQYSERPRQIRFRPEYMPKPNSPKFEYIQDIRRKVSTAVTKKCGDLYQKLSRGLKWISPEVDAYSVGFDQKRHPRPDKWYFDDCWVYVWHPTLAYRALLPSDKHPCAYCGLCDTESKGWHYRMSHEWTREVFILHQRYECKNPKCKGTFDEEGECASKTFATIDPKALSRLPTAVARRFEFLCLKGSIGVHLSLLDMFQCLSTQSDVLFQVFANAINELKMRRYHQQMESFLDRLTVWTNQSFDLAYDGSAVPFYSAFGEVGYHNGVRLSVSLLKRAWIHASKVSYDYRQSSFEHDYDETLSADISFKLSKKVRAEVHSQEKVRVMDGTLSMLNGNGKICVSRGLYGKAHDDIAPTLCHLREAREKSNAPTLLQLNTDNPKADKSLFEQCLPDLRSGLMKTNPVSSFPSAYLEDDRFRFFNKKQDLEHFMITHGIDHLQSLCPDSKGYVYYGLDAEWNVGTPAADGLALLQLSFPGLPVLVIHVHRMQIPQEITNILTDKKYVPCGRNITGDLNRLAAYKIMVDYRIELGNLARVLGSDSRRTSLSSLSQEYLGYTIANKEYGQHGNYEAEQLDAELIRYAATDALVSRLLAEEMTRRAAGLDSATLSGSNLLSAGADVQIVCQRSIVADATIVFLGNEHGLGGMKKFGKTTVGTGKAIVRINTVLKSTWKVPYGRDEGDGSLSSFKKGSVLQEVFQNSPDKEILVNTCVLRLPLPDPSVEIEYLSGKKSDVPACEPPPEQPTTPLELSTEKQEVQSPRPSEQGKSSDAIKDLLQDSPTLLDSLARAVTEEQEDYCEGVTSRLKYDIFHQFDSMPLGRDSPIAIIVFKLLNVATFVKHSPDWLQLLALLKRKLGIEDENAACEHEFFNRTFHRRRVRVSTPSAQDHAGNIRAVHKVIQETNGLQEHYTEDLGKWFHTFELRASQGWFEAIDGVNMYQHDGTDQDGLDLWSRNQGTSRLENFHQKLEGLIGSHTVGVEVADHLLLARAFHYNVQTGIKRCGEPNLGHSDLAMVDRIQTKIREKYGIWVLPSHTNLSDYIGMRTNWVTVVPISAPSECVDLSSNPYDGLSRDLSYMARRQGVRMPPLPPVTPEDRKLLIKKFKQCLAKPTKVDLLRICAELKIAADGKQIFPKVPSMVLAYYEQYKKNESLRSIQHSLGLPFTQLLSSLNKQRTLEQPESRVREPPGTGNLPFLDTAKQFVPPIQAPHQKSEIVASIRPCGQESRACAWYPMCSHKAVDCGGYMMTGCKYFGAQIANNKQAAKEARNRVQRKRKELSDSLPEQTNDRDCAWWPLCTAGIKQCRGTKPTSCLVYGQGGLLKPPDDFLKLFESARQQRINFKKKIHRKLRELAKLEDRHSKKKGRTCTTVATEETFEWSAVRVMLLDKETGSRRVVVYDNQVYILGGPLSICHVGLHTHDVFDLLKSENMLNDQVIEVYLKLLRKSSVGTEAGVGSVNTNFWSHLQQNGWEKVKKWVRTMDSGAADWDMTSLIFVPIFSGPRQCGHWSNLILDRKFAEESSNPNLLFIYADSLNGEHLCGEIQSEFATVPFASRPSVSWKHATSPLQHGMDCGVWTCLKFAAWAHAASRGILYEKQAGANGIEVGFSVTMDVGEWGQKGREHILKSFCDGAIDFNADVLKALHVKVTLPS